MLTSEFPPGRGHATNTGSVPVGSVRNRCPSEASRNDSLLSAPPTTRCLPSGMKLNVKGSKNKPAYFALRLPEQSRSRNIGNHHTGNHRRFVAFTGCQQLAIGRAGEDGKTGFRRPFGYHLSRRQTKYGD